VGPALGPQFAHVGRKVEEVAVLPVGIAFGWIQQIADEASERIRVGDLEKDITRLLRVDAADHVGLHGFRQE